MKCCMISWLRPSNSSSNDHGPDSVSNSYGVSIATIGSRRRAALTESLSLISSFSRTSSSTRARSHSARETIGGMASAVPIPRACHQASAEVADHLGDLTHLVDVRARRDQVHLVGADVGEPLQDRVQLFRGPAQPVVGAIASTISAGIQFM